MSKPEEAMGDGPFIYLTLPSAIAQHVPVNATKLIWEWEAFLDPVTAIVDAHRWLVRSDGKVSNSKSFIEPTTKTVFMLREVALSEEVAGVLEDSRSKAVVKDNKVTNDGLPLLAGLAVTAALHKEFGFQSRGAMELMAEPIKNARENLIRDEVGELDRVEQQTHEWGTPPVIDEDDGETK